MKRASKPRQFTDVLMLPVDVRRAEQLAKSISDPTSDGEPEQFIDETLELVLGIAAIDDAEERQSSALAAAITIYSSTRHCQNSLASFMAEYYGKER